MNAIRVLEDDTDALEDQRRVEANAQCGRSFDRKKIDEALRRAAELRDKAAPSDLNDE